MNAESDEMAAEELLASYEESILRTIFEAEAETHIHRCIRLHWEGRNPHSAISDLKLLRLLPN